METTLDFRLNKVDQFLLDGTKDLKIKQHNEATIIIRVRQYLQPNGCFIQRVGAYMQCSFKQVNLEIKKCSELWSQLIISSGPINDELGQEITEMELTQNQS